MPEHGGREGHEGRDKRAARNESAFRSVNEELQGVAVAEELEPATFVCECANLGCAELLTMPTSEYERVRRSPRLFIVAPSEEHVGTDVESVRERHESYWVVEKRGEAARAAESLDPRS